jgi:acyl transferase domain-containing protein
MLSPDSTMIEGHATMLSPDSTSYSFDHRANGFSRGEGTATVIIKRLSDAVRDGDTIRAVIRSTGSNNNGHGSVGIMQPNGEAQVNLIHHTYEKAGLSMDQTRFCEAHGTGTVVGDSIEMNALGQAFQSALSADRPLIVYVAKFPHKRKKRQNQKSIKEANVKRRFNHFLSNIGAPSNPILAILREPVAWLV